MRQEYGHERIVISEIVLTIRCGRSRWAVSGSGYLWPPSLPRRASGAVSGASPPLAPCHCCSSDVHPQLCARRGRRQPGHGGGPCTARTVSVWPEKCCTFWMREAILEIAADCFQDLINWFRWLSSSDRRCLWRRRRCAVPTLAVESWVPL